MCGAGAGEAEACPQKEGLSWVPVPQGLLQLSSALREQPQAGPHPSLTPCLCVASPGNLRDSAGPSSDHAVLCSELVMNMSPTEKGGRRKCQGGCFFKKIKGIHINSVF
ncbi:hypothetical protein H1C71_035128 [Ictidomys tridecemlineatus]|nr:hypothetical protein H1C71_035128 [Ictidomys tridecemlineatus]